MDALSETRERLLKDDPNFRRLAQKHQEYDDRLEAIRAKRFPTDEEKLEETRLKKLKLAVKDEMEQILRRTRD
jgi:uncharacterized protein YdcH (DUF465 family)